MSYIGKTPATGNFVKLDAITTSSTNTYNLLKDSVAFTPESANHMIVSLNGVIQAPSTAFSVSGSQITFIPASGTLSSSDTIDFILVLGNVLDIGTPSDDTISASKLQTDSVQTAKIVDDAVTKAKVNFISDATAGVEVKGDGGSNDGYIQLNCSQNSHGVKIKSPPHSAGQSYTLTLPQSITNDYYLKTDGSGNLSFAEVSSDRVKLGSSDISDVASVTFDVFTDDYRSYEIIFDNVVQSDARYIRMRPRNASGTISSGMYSVIQAYEDAGGSQARDDTHLSGSDHFRLHNGNGPRNSSSASIVEPYGSLLHMTIGDVRTSGEPFVWSLHGFNFDYDGNRNGTVTAAGTTQSNFDVYTGVEFAPNGSGTFVSGKITIYGNK